MFHPDPEIDDIVAGFLAIQARAATEQHRAPARASHAKGVWVNASFTVLDLAAEGVPSAHAARLARGIFARPQTFPSMVRLCNSSPFVESDWEPDVRGLSFSVDLRESWLEGRSPADRQDFSLSSAPVMPFNDLRSYRVNAALQGASSTAVALGSMSFEDQQVYAATQQRLMQQKRQPIRPYQKLRYWSTTPYRHGESEVIKYSVIPRPANPAARLDRRRRDALSDELQRHLRYDDLMSEFDFALQFLDTAAMTYRGRQRDAGFWIENAAVEWPESQAPFHAVARLCFLPHSGQREPAPAQAYFDVQTNALPEHAPLGRVNLARCAVYAASRAVRLGKDPRMCHD